MPDRVIIASANFEEHNKAHWEKEAARELRLRNGCTCSYWELESKNLKTLMKIYTHAKSCPKHEEKTKKSNA